MDKTDTQQEVHTQRFDGIELTVTVVGDEISDSKPTRKGTLTVNASDGSAYFLHTPSVPRKRNKRLIRTAHLSVLEDPTTGHYSGTISFNKSERGVNKKLMQEFMRIVVFLFDKKNGYLKTTNEKEK